MEHLTNVFQTIQRVDNWVVFIGSILTLIAWVIVVALLIKRKQLMKLTNSIKVSFMLYLFQLILSIHRIVRLNMGIVESTYDYVSLVLQGFLFASNHWIFSWHYFSAAYLFRLTFWDHDVESIYRLQKRKKVLKVINISAQVTIFIISVTLILLAIFDEGKFHETFGRAWGIASSLFLLVLALLSNFSMRHIQRSSKKLEQHGIYANKILFGVYLICWVISFVGKTSRSILLIYCLNPQEDWSLAGTRVYLAFECSSLLKTVGLLFLNLTILLTYLKFSNRLNS